MSSDDVAVSISGLSKSYRIFGHPGDRIKQALTFGRVHFHQDFKALTDVSFDVRKGETVGIIGRNGSGKSTLLQLISGILKPTSGRVAVAGRISALLELGTGFHPEFTGRENVYFQGAVMGFSPAQMDERFDGIAAFADIGEFIDQPVRTYSSGMYVRLAFATAISVAPDVLLVDEALAVGDATFQSRCHAKFAALKNAGKTVLFVTHDLNQVIAHCERAIVLDHGRLMAEGTPKQAVDCYRRLLGQTDRSSTASIAAGRGDWKNLFRLNVDETRYGDHRHEVVEAGLFTDEDLPTQVLRRGEMCSVRIRLLHHNFASMPFASLVVKDLKGQPIFGTTTEWEGTLATSAGHKKSSEVILRFPMLLNPGHYLLSVGVQSRTPRGETVAHDHRTDYLMFEVIGQQRHGFFCPPFESQWN